ncbi:MAG: carbohydrate-binding domain-containing protein [Bacteroidaceae bacterium]|nr:carbohydrate-binding domain-containing protein [Bacteroidaceae bacterium]
MIFSCRGLLTVNGTGKNDICSDEYIIFRPGCNIYVAAMANHGIKANETIEVRGGVINILSTATAA